MTAAQRSQRYQCRRYKEKRCITCAEKNSRWPKQKCQSCADKQSKYYKERGRHIRIRPTVRLLKFMANKVKQLENEVRRLKNAS